MNWMEFDLLSCRAFFFASLREIFFNTQPFNSAHAEVHHQTPSAAKKSPPGPGYASR